MYRYDKKLIKEKEVSFKEKFLATRLAIENILFEKEISPQRKPEKKYYLLAFLLFVGHFFINLYYFYRQRDLNFFPNLNYSKMGLKEILFQTDILANSLEMPLYYILLKLLSFVVNINPWSIFFINTLIAFFGLIGYFLFVTKTRNERTAVFAVAVLLSSPFFFDITREYSSKIVTFTSLVWTYYYFVKMKIDEQYRSVPFFVLFYSLGLLSDKFFLIYTLPCFSFLSFLLTTTYSSYITTIFFPAALLSLAFYLRFLVIEMFKYSFGIASFSYFNLKEIFKIYGDLLGISFILIVPFFIWMNFAVYNIYVAKKEVVRWVFYPLLLFFVVLPSEDLVRFTTPALIVGFSVMVFGDIRRFLFYFFIAVMFLSGLNILPLQIKGYRLLGWVDKRIGEEKIVRHILYAISNEVKDSLRPFVVSVRSYENRFKASSFDIFKRRYLLANVKFYNFPDELLVFSCYVITDKKTDYIKGFDEIIRYKGVYLLKNPFCKKGGLGNISGKFSVNVGDLEISDMRVVSERGGNDYLYLDIGYLGYKGIDLYGVNLKLKDAYLDSNYRYTLAGFSKVEIVNAIINQYSLNAFFERLTKKSSKIEFLDDVIRFESIVKNLNLDIVAYFSPILKDNVIYFNLSTMKIGFIKLGPFFSRFLVFSFPYERVFPVSFNRIRISNQLIKIS